MQQRVQLVRRIAGALAGLGMLAGAAAVGAAPAHAYSPDPTPSTIKVNTDKTRYYNDVIDGTEFLKDKGGDAVKIGLWHSGKYVGKVEFHPYDEKLWVYDNGNDGDSAVYGRISWYNKYSGQWMSQNFSAPVTAATVDKRIYDLNMHEGAPVKVYLYDDKGHRDYITESSGTA